METCLYFSVVRQPLRVAMHGKDRIPFLTIGQTFDRLRFALDAMDGLRLLAVFIDGQDHAAVQHLFVEIDRRRREEDHHRPIEIR